MVWGWVALAFVVGGVVGFFLAAAMAGAGRDARADDAVAAEIARIRHAAAKDEDRRG